MNKKDYIRQHKKLWSEIIRLIPKKFNRGEKSISCIKDLAWKNCFLECFPIKNKCFGCFFAQKENGTFSCCDCLFDVNNDNSYNCLNGLYNKFTDFISSDAAINLAKKIKNFPVRGK